MDNELLQALEAQRAQVQGLEVQLAPRRAAEAAECDTLERTRRDAERRTQALALEADAARARAEALRAEQLRLQQGLSAARRAWVRIVEPLVASALLFFAIIVVGLARVRGTAQRVVLYEVLALLAGVALAVVARRVRGHRA